VHQAIFVLEHMRSMMGLLPILSENDRRTYRPSSHFGDSSSSSSSRGSGVQSTLGYFGGDAIDEDSEEFVPMIFKPLNVDRKQKPHVDADVSTEGVNHEEQGEGIVGDNKRKMNRRNSTASSDVDDEDDADARRPSSAAKRKKKTKLAK
jgi:hypothetical protein